MNLCVVPSLRISQPQPPPRTFRPVLSVVNQEGRFQHHRVSRRSLRIYHSICRFFSNLRQPPASPVHDVYTLAFLGEVLNLVIVLFGYWAFGVSLRVPGPSDFQTAPLSTWLSWEPLPRPLGSWGCSVPPQLWGVGWGG